MLWAVLGVAILIVILLFVLRARRKTVPQYPGFLILLSSPQVLTLEQLKLILEPEVGSIKEVDRTDVAGSLAFQTVISIDSEKLRISGTPGPPGEFKQKFAEEVSDRRAQEVILAHTHILTVELMTWSEDKIEDDKELMSMVAGYLMDERAIGFDTIPSTGIYPLNEEVKELLRDGDYEEAMNAVEAPVKMVDHDDAAMVAAIAKARETWPEFLQHFREEVDGCFVKVRIDYEDQSEHLWIIPLRADESGVMGELTNEPMDIPFLSFGSQVEASFDQISDWTVYRGKQQLGGYTVPLLMD